MFPPTCPKRSAFRSPPRQGPKDLFPAIHSPTVGFIHNCAKEAGFRRYSKLPEQCKHLPTYAYIYLHFYAFSDKPWTNRRNNRAFSPNTPGIPPEQPLLACSAENFRTSVTFLLHGTKNEHKLVDQKCQAAITSGTKAGIKPNKKKFIETLPTLVVFPMVTFSHLQTLSRWVIYVCYCSESGHNSL